VEGGGRVCEPRWRAEQPRASGAAGVTPTLEVRNPPLRVCGRDVGWAEGGGRVCRPGGGANDLARQGLRRGRQRWGRETRPYVLGGGCCVRGREGAGLQAPMPAQTTSRVRLFGGDTDVRAEEPAPTLGRGKHAPLRVCGRDDGWWRCWVGERGEGGFANPPSRVGGPHVEADVVGDEGGPWRAMVSRMTARRKSSWSAGGRAATWRWRMTVRR